MKQEAEYEIKNEIHKQLQSLINENKDEIQNQLVTKIVKELMEQICFSVSLKDILYKKIIDGIEARYEDKYNLAWDLELSQRLKDIYKENKTKFDNILFQKIDEAINDYKVEDYTISGEIANILTTDDKYHTILKDFLDSRIDDILNKI